SISAEQPLPTPQAISANQVPLNLKNIPAACPQLKPWHFRFYAYAPSSPAPYGCYVLSILDQRGCEISFLLEREGYGDSPKCENRSYFLVAKGTTNLNPNREVILNGQIRDRRYTFRINLKHPQLDGEFEVWSPSLAYDGKLTETHRW
ncbi:MAG: hypothetical protein NZM37_07265, partial [Sandaracinaceae bacterium]|nr:hypothetical protein [Sandaracinaceae bacterium]